MNNNINNKVLPAQNKIQSFLNALKSLNIF